MDTSANNKNALITGGSSGIGLAIAHELAARGYNLVLASNQQKELDESKEEIQLRFQVSVLTHFIDLAKPHAALKLFDWCNAQNLQVDILVNNAGIFFFGEVVESKSEKISQMMALHITTPTELCVLFGHKMKKRRNGHILNIASLAAYMQYPGIALYGSTKSYMKNFSRALRTEMIDYNVNVTCICPGAVSTNLFEMTYTDRKKALKSGIMMSSEKLAKKAVGAMYKRKPVVIPGVLNRFFRLVVLLVPHGLILLIRRYSKLLPPEKV